LTPIIRVWLHEIVSQQLVSYGSFSIDVWFARTGALSQKSSGFGNAPRNYHVNGIRQRLDGGDPAEMN
jgi:hypothetical protein